MTDYVNNKLDGAYYQRYALVADEGDPICNDKSDDTGQYLNKDVTLKLLKDYVMTDQPSFKPEDFRIEIGNFGFKPSALKEWKIHKRTIHIIDNKDNEYSLEFLGKKHAKWFADEKLKAYKEEEDVDSE